MLNWQGAGGLVNRTIFPYFRDSALPVLFTDTFQEITEKAVVK